MARPEPSEMCRLRKDDRLFTTAAVWKVTARYTLWLSEKRKVNCVRVSSNYVSNNGVKSPNVILHLSEAEYTRLFAPIEQSRKKEKL